MSEVFDIDVVDSIEQIPRECWGSVASESVSIEMRLWLLGLANVFQGHLISNDHIEVPVVRKRELDQDEITGIRETIVAAIPFAMTAFRAAVMIDRITSGKFKAFARLDSSSSGVQ